MFPLRRFRVRDRSMEPTLLEGDQVIASPLPYRWRPPAVGDLVVLRHPTEPRFLVKRVVDVDGQRVSVRGDNRDRSTDSRAFGPVSRDALVGKVLLRWSRRPG